MKIRVRRRPIILEAEEWTPETPVEGVLFFQGDGLCCPDYWYIETLEGQMRVSPGYMVVTGRAGEKWAVRPDIFWDTYERLEDEGC